MRRYKKYAEYPIAQLRIICLTETSLTGELRQPCVYIRNNKPPQVMQNLRRSEFVALRCNFFIEIVCYGHGENLCKSEFAGFNLTGLAKNYTDIPLHNQQ